jgi:hypothetical protein
LSVNVISTTPDFVEIGNLLFLFEQEGVIPNSLYINKNNMYKQEFKKISNLLAMFRGKMQWEREKCQTWDIHQSPCYPSTNHFRFRI